MYSTIGFGTASKATPQGRRLYRAGVGFYGESILTWHEVKEVKKPQEIQILNQTNRTLLQKMANISDQIKHKLSPQEFDLMQEIMGPGFKPPLGLVDPLHPKNSNFAMDLSSTDSNIFHEILRLEGQPQNAAVDFETDRLSNGSVNDRGARFIL